MSLYGLSICPILKIPGFFFGCAYTGSYILSVLFFNFCLISYLYFSDKKLIPKFFRKNTYLLYILSYLIASSIALIVLSFIFNLNHISGDSRAPEILLLTSLLLGITQAYGLNWALGDLELHSPLERTQFKFAWLQHTLRTMAPILASIIVLLHFLLIQSYLLTRKDIFPMNSEEIVEQTTYVVLFVITWLIMTYFFHFLSEGENARKIKSHVENLQDEKYDYQSIESNSWGLWRSLLQHLNDFSKVFSERTKLLKSFSRFVTNEVAQHALVNELDSVGGKEEELTVIMSDIRDFTKISQRMSPNDVVDMLNNYFSLMIDEMMKHKIVVDKFIGDGILAYVENERLEEKHLQNQQAVRASVGMLQKIKEHQLDLKIGIGIYRGPLVKGYIGSRSKLQHTIIGDSVNRAARLEALCKELDVPLVITHEIWLDLDEQTRKKFKIFKDVKMKGVDQSVDVYGLQEK